ncbi:cytochrome P450 2B4 [Lingula anatina]|uniref:Cytochrome P450 2B4 n=1 Tax=Lingula anatina TaxID=7574 RepID=A0A1S3JQ05_LINAN|nr:cytochrome P450 2B4 [Lingula anatina]|eukprot:XP_013412458.1 cytochrome P450 2B4 [Lingula anatina]
MGGVIQAAALLQGGLDISTLLVFVIVFCLGIWLLRSYTEPRVNWPPGPRPLPIIGNLNKLGKPRQVDDLYLLFDQYGDIVHLKLGQVHAVALGTYDVIFEALVTKSHAFSDRLIKILVLPGLVEEDGAGIVRKNGHAWKELRRMAISTLRDFGMGKTSLEAKIREEARCLVQGIEAKDGKPFDPKLLITHTVNNIISTIVFGSRHEIDDPFFSTMQQKLEELFRTFGLGLTTFLPWAEIFMPSTENYKKLRVEKMKELTEMIKTEVEEHRKTFDPENIRDFIDCYLKTLQEEKDLDVFTEKNVFFVIVDLYLAGTETTASALQWGVVHMMHHPDVQQKVQAEIDRVIGREKVPCYEDRHKMPYTEATVLEIMRRSPVAPNSLAHATSETVELRGYTIPANTLVIPDIGRVLRSPSYWEDPLEFRPERWLDKTGKVLKNDKYIPFSIGPRVCPGKNLAEIEDFIFFTTMLQHFTFQNVPGQELPDVTKGPFHVTFEPYPFQVRAVRR